MQIFIERLEKVLHGMRLADLTCSYDNSIFYFIINRHIGDSVRVLRMLKSVKEYYGPQAKPYHECGSQLQNSMFRKKKKIEKIVVLTTNAIAGVARLYSDAIDDIKVFTKSDLDTIELYAASGLGLHENIITDDNTNLLVKNNRNTDEESRIHQLLFGIKDFMWDICIPSNIVYDKMQISEDTKRNTAIFISKHSLDIQKAVVLCPVARTSSMLDESLWQVIIKNLTKRGFIVYTNIAGNEKALSETLPLMVDIDILANLALMGCRIIGVQCGLIDVLANINPSKLIVLSVIKTDRDRHYAHVVGARQEVSKVKNITYLRIEHFEEDYVLKLLEDNFH